MWPQIRNLRKIPTWNQIPRSGFENLGKKNGEETNMPATMQGMAMSMGDQIKAKMY